MDVRTFQYPGAGGILLSDDVGGFLEPWYEYLPYESGSVESVLYVLDRLRTSIDGDLIRRNAIQHVQESHSATARVGQALAAVGLAL